MNSFIDKNTTKNTLKDLLENAHYLYKIVNQNKPVIYTEEPRFATKYNIYDHNECNFSTPFQYFNGENIRIGDIIKVKNYLKDDLHDIYKNIGEKTFVVKFDFQTKDGCYLYDGSFSTPISYLKDEINEKKEFKAIGNIYEYLYECLKDYEDKERYNIDEKLIKDVIIRDSETFLDKNTTLYYQHIINPRKFKDTFKLKHNELEEFIQLCKSNSAIQNLAKQPISKDISISLFYSGLGGNRIYTISLNECILLAMSDEITEHKKLLRAIDKTNTQRFWQNFETDILRLNEDINHFDNSQKEKERILNEINALNEQFQRANIHKEDKDKYQIKNTQSLENIYQFRLKHDSKQALFQQFENKVIKISNEIQRFEKNKAVLLPEAKQRIVKEILTKRNQLDKLIQEYKKDTNHLGILYDMNANRIKKPFQILSNFYSNYTDKNCVNTR